MSVPTLLQLAQDPLMEQWYYSPISNVTGNGGSGGGDGNNLSWACFQRQSSGAPYSPLPEENRYGIELLRVGAAIYAGNNSLGAQYITWGMQEAEFLFRYQSQADGSWMLWSNNGQYPGGNSLGKVFHSAGFALETLGRGLIALIQAGLTNTYRSWINRAINRLYIGAQWMNNSWSSSLQYPKTVGDQYDASFNLNTTVFTHRAYLSGLAMMYAAVLTNDDLLMQSALAYMVKGIGFQYTASSQVMTADTYSGSDPASITYSSVAAAYGAVAGDFPLGTPPLGKTWVQYTSPIYSKYLYPPYAAPPTPSRTFLTSIVGAAPEKVMPCVSNADNGYLPAGSHPMTDRGRWQSACPYVIGDYLVYNSTPFVAITSSQNQVPQFKSAGLDQYGKPLASMTNSAYWAQVYYAQPDGIDANYGWFRLLLMTYACSACSDATTRASLLTALSAACDWGLTIFDGTSGLIANWSAVTSSRIGLTSGELRPGTTDPKTFSYRLALQGALNAYNILGRSDMLTLANQIIASQYQSAPVPQPISPFTVVLGGVVSNKMGALSNSNQSSVVVA